MLSVSSRIWTRVAVSISYDDNDYTMGTSSKDDLLLLLWVTWNHTTVFKLFISSIR